MNRPTLMAAYNGIVPYLFCDGAEAALTRLIACIDDRPVGNRAIWTIPSPRRRHAGELAMAMAMAMAMA